MTEENLSHDWYAVCTRHQHEKSAARILEYKQFEVFLPLYKVRRRWQDRIKEISVPLFPGYVFVRGGPARRSEEHTSELQSLTNLVCRLLLEKKKMSDRLGRDLGRDTPKRRFQYCGTVHPSKTLER